MTAQTDREGGRKVDFDTQALNKNVLKRGESQVKNYAPDPTYESAQQLGRLSTIEVMTLVKRRAQIGQATGLGSFAENITTEVTKDQNLSTVRIKLPPDISWKARQKKRWESFREWFRKWAAGWYQRNVPKTLDQNRLGIQWICCLLITSGVLWSEKAYSFFGAQESFIMISAIAVLDTSYGAHIIKAGDRIMGTAGAVAIAQLLFIPLYYGGVKTLDWGLKIFLFFYGSAVAWFWCYIRALKPTHVTLPVVGIATSAGIFAMVRDNYVHSTWIVGLCNAIGILIGAIVFGCVFPKSARSALLKDLKTICDKIAQTLEPLVEFEAGVVDSPSFFQKSMANKTGEGLLRTISKQFSRSRSSGDISVTAEPAHVRRQKGVEVLDSDIFEGFRVAVWKQIEAIYTLLDAQNTLLAPASHELSRKTPHRFPVAEYENFYAALKRLFYHVVSLYLVLDTQSSAIRDVRMMELLGDRVMYAGVGIKIDPYKEVSTTDDIGKVLPLRHRWSIPGGGLARTLERPATEFEISRQRGKSIPTFAAVEPDIIEEFPEPNRHKSTQSTPLTARPSPPTGRIHNVQQRSASNVACFAPAEDDSVSLSTPTPPSLSPQVRQSVANKPSASEEGRTPTAGQLTAATLKVPIDNRQQKTNNSSSPTSSISPQRPCDASPIFTSPTFSSPAESYLSLTPPVKAKPDTTKESPTDSTLPPQTPPPPHPPLLNPSGRQLSLVSVLSEISHQSARTGTAIDDIINATPVVRWVEMYGPLIGRVSKHVASAVLQFSTCLERREMAGPLDDHILLAEEALGELTSRRVLWFRTVQIIFNAQLLKPDGTDHETPEEVRACIDECLFRRWMGLTPEAYCALSLQARTNFWEAFGNIQDRLSTTARILMGLLVELKTCRSALATFVAAKRGVIASSATAS